MRPRRCQRFVARRGSGYASNLNSTSPAVIDTAQASEDTRSASVSISSLDTSSDWSAYGRRAAGCESLSTGLSPSSVDRRRKRDPARGAATTRNLLKSMGCSRRPDWQRTIPLTVSVFGENSIAWQKIYWRPTLGADPQMWFPRRLPGPLSVPYNSPSKAVISL